MHLELDLGADLRLHLALDPGLHLATELLMHHLAEHVLAVADLLLHLLLKHVPEQISAHVAHLLVEQLQPVEAILLLHLESFGALRLLLEL